MWARRRCHSRDSEIARGFGVGVRGSPLTVIMALVEDIEMNIPCLSPPSLGQDYAL